MKRSWIVPLTTLFGGLFLITLSGFSELNFTIDVGMYSAFMYAGLGSSAAVGFAKIWRKN